MMENKQKRLLIVEDDILLAQILTEILLEAGYTVLGSVDTGKGAITKARELKPDLIFMDIMLKDQMSGCEAAMIIRQNQKECKIIFLTAFAEKEMIEYAQECKACAFLLKPYREKEILATLALVLSQENPIPRRELEKVNLGHGFSFHFKPCTLYQEGKEIPLSEKKRKLIELLSKNINTCVSIEQICSYVWGESHSVNTVRSLVHRLKEAIGHDLIHSTNGVGYIIYSDDSIYDT